MYAIHLALDFALRINVGSGWSRSGDNVMAITKFALNTQVLIGSGACREIGALADQLGVRNILLVTDAGLVKAGLADRVAAPLDRTRFTVTLYSEVEPDPTVNVVDRGAAQCREAGCELVLAVGGGSAIDAGKGIAVVATNGGSSADYEGMNKYTRAPLPLFAVPTTCGTGSEVTFGAVLTKPDTNYKFILYGTTCAPVAAFLDPDLLLGMPRQVMVPTGMDALTHAVESYLSKGATPQSRPLALEAIRLIGRHFLKAAANTRNGEAMSQMLYAANIAGMAFACSRLGIVHAMALPLGAFFHVPHGIANSILLPHGLAYNLGYHDQGYCAMAAALGEDLTGQSPQQGAAKLVEAVRKLARDVQAPSRLSEVGVKEDKIKEMARDTMKSSHIPANPRPIKEEEVAQLYRQAM
jgi:alcohol dehydrogenase class IV